MTISETRFRIPRITTDKCLDARSAPYFQARTQLSEHLEAPETCPQTSTVHDSLDQSFSELPYKEDPAQVDLWFQVLSVRLLFWNIRSRVYIDIFQLCLALLDEDPEVIYADVLWVIHFGHASYLKSVRVFPNLIVAWYFVATYTSDFSALYPFSHPFQLHR
jgi:hypothetical protein